MNYGSPVKFFLYEKQFSAFGEAGYSKFGVEGAFEQASQKVYSWGKNKFRNVIKNAPKFEELACFSEKRDGSEFGALMVHEDGLFAFRAAHPDASVAGRMWVTDTELKVKIISAFCSKVVGYITSVLRRKRSF